MDENKDTQAAGAPTSGAEGNQDQAASQGAAQAAEGIDPQLAEQMLNRLEDKPGRALMPPYQGREVEEDW
jgi:Ca-activated chloride channel family protein